MNGDETDHAVVQGGNEGLHLIEHPERRSRIICLGSKLHRLTAESNQDFRGVMSELRKELLLSRQGAGGRDDQRVEIDVTTGAGPMG